MRRVNVKVYSISEFKRLLGLEKVDIESVYTVVLTKDGKTEKKVYVEYRPKLRRWR